MYWYVLCCLWLLCMCVLCTTQYITNTMPKTPKTPTINTTLETPQNTQKTLNNTQQAAADFKSRMTEHLKDSNDRFDEMVAHEERIRLGEEGWKSRYYQEKLGLPPGPQQEAVVQDMVRSFVEGICWVMEYYYEGVASWTWYYPYHYAPFASDMHYIAGMQPKFELGQPFKPFNQLMGVLPAASCHCLPKVGCVCAHRNIHTHTYTCIHTYINTHILTHRNALSLTHTRKCKHTHTHIETSPTEYTKTHRHISVYSQQTTPPFVTSTPPNLL